MQQSASIIDTLSEGYRAIHRRPAALLLVFAFNLALLLTAPVSFAPLFDRFDGFLARLAGASTETTGDAQSQMSALLAELGQTDLRQALALMNVMPRFIVPRFAPGALATNGADAVITIASVPAAALTFVLINLIVFPIGVLFLTLVGAAVRGEPAWQRDLWRAMVRIGAAVIGVMAILVAAFVLIGFPFALVAALLMAVNDVLGVLAFSLILVVMIWVQIYVGFANEAIVMSRVGPLRALRASFELVRRNLWGVVGFLLLSLLITRGTEVIWEMLGASMIGGVAAALGSAYIGVGLAAARMAFYRERVRRLSEQQAIRPGAAP
ncbi:MAG: hypothetical protein C0183_23315 [Roseiflexus castenholzii]|uniref:hypothetical protein n=1 Tax=Roseiflexus castenholzii TaxID=120962 RepID=UPI000CC4A74B|nr:MAG: hypothetical protein C0183_23315 [Roseiflexus castenholzii]